MAVNPYMSVLAAALAGQSPQRGTAIMPGAQMAIAPTAMPMPTSATAAPLPPITAGGFNLGPSATALGAGGLGVPGVMPVAGQPIMNGSYGNLADIQKANPGFSLPPNMPMR